MLAADSHLQIDSMILSDKKNIFIQLKLAKKTIIIIIN